MPIGLSQTTFDAPRTVRDLIDFSYRIARVIGRGESLDAVTANEAGYRLNDIIEQANIEKVFSSYQQDLTIPLVSGQSFYTIGGSGAHINAARPTEILHGYVRRENIDYPASISHSKNDYDAIALKSLQFCGWSTFVYYQASYPFGSLYVYPVPSDSLSSLHLTVESSLEKFSSLDDEVLIPPTYFSWLQYKLAERVAPDYGQIWTEKNEAILDDIEGALIRNNMKPAPRVRLGLSGLSGGSGYGYNVTGDR